ncbi:Ig-like domain-containing protein, partial [Pantoea sp.]|uniref:Ig-like domain-containing protein n=1 Tax=Pantoea sp. TaxID=69393 RepID=UPI00289A8D43
MRAILVAHHAGKPTKAVTLNGSKLQKIKMSADSQFYIRTEEDNFAPENITLKRDGNDLYLLLEGDEKPSLLIKDYYLYPQAQLLGMAEDHQLYAYQLTQGGDENGLLAQGETAPCALGGPALGAGDEIFAGQDDSNGAILPWLFGVLGLGAATTGVLAIRNHNKKNDHHETPSVVEQNPPPEKPVMHGVTDNVGTLQGVLPNGGATDDTTPTFSGKGQPDCTINIIIDGQIVGSTKVDAEGNWSWTPEQPLGEGHHQVVTTQTDASGQTSPASPTYDFDVDTQAPGKPSVSEITDNVGDVTGPLHNGDATDDTQP